jgi:hypothetical protein
MKTITLLILVVFSSVAAQATHLIGGYVQAKSAAGSALTYEITAALYMNEISAAVDQAVSVSICFGDGTSAVASRQSRTFGTNRAFSLNIYRITHTYAGPGTYALTVSMANRTGVNNIANAVSIPLTLGTTISVNSATANQTPTPDFPNTGFLIGLNQKATISLKATDADGDSLVYGLARALTGPANEGCGRQVVANYQFPNDVTRQGTFKLANRTGELVWNAPTKEGAYSIVMTIDEYRNGLFISQTTQEITLTVADMPGTPGSIPAYEPAIEGTSSIITATTPFIDSDLTLTAFPNPVDDRLQVVIQSSNPATATIQLWDVAGRQLHKLNFTKPARQHEQMISMGSLTPGVYLIRAEVNGRVLQQKVVKN